MKKILTALIIPALGLAVQAADFGVYLDSNDGSSALVIYDNQTNQLMSVQSDGPVETVSNLTVSGIVSAVSFEGDGSDMTGVVTSETDPVWEAEKAGYATGTPVYVEADPVWEAEKAEYATGTPVYVETDPIWEAEKAAYATGTPLYIEADPVFGASVAASITGLETGQWTEAYGWGDHELGGYADSADLVSASNALQTAIDTETSARIGADAALSNEVSGIASDLGDEAAARIGADAALSNDVSGIASDLGDETAARIGADAALSNEVSGIASDLGDEAAARIGADAALSNEVSGIASDLGDEATARIGADAALSNEVSGIASDLGDEAAARIGADAALSNDVSGISSDLSDETSARIGADAALSNAVSGEAAARIGADAALSNDVSGISSDLSDETSARIGADAALSNAVGTLVTDLNTASNALQTDVSTRLDSNFWAAADSTTNYMRLSDGVFPQNMVWVATNGTASGPGSLNAPYDTPQNGYNSAAALFPSQPATLVITAGSYPGLVAGSPNIHVSGISRPQLASLTVTGVTSGIVGSRRIDGIVVTGSVFIGATGVKLDNMRVQNGLTITGQQIEVQNSFITVSSTTPAVDVRPYAQNVAIYNSSIESAQSTNSLKVGDVVTHFEVIGCEIINTAGFLTIDDLASSPPTPIHLYTHNYIKSTGAATSAMQINVVFPPFPPFNASVAFHNNTVWGDLVAKGGAGLHAQFSNNSIYGTNSWLQAGTVTSDGYNNTHHSRSTVQTLPDSWDD
ncbi:MAG TPA: hypothetical protein PKM67_02885 [Kiritimatiellia bacterium]|nr:hypothetical protein [Kiritimatiellia bacterium]HNS80384.1 hypothetical protein [Kiritimatiellia bacterium]